MPHHHGGLASYDARAHTVQELISYARQAPPPTSQVASPQSTSNNVLFHTRFAGTSDLRPRLARLRETRCSSQVRCTHPIPLAQSCNRSTSRNLLILLHGAAMRTGGERTTGNTFDDSAVKDQLSVLHALKEHAFDHAGRWGFSTHILVDVPTAGWPVHHSTWWQLACRRILGTNMSFSPHREAAGSQTESVHRVLKWASKSLEWQWDALLMTRPDLMLRADLPLPCDVDAVIGAFETRGLDEYCTQASWTAGERVRCGVVTVQHKLFAVPADAIMWVPSQQRDAFLAALQSKLNCREELHHLHDLCGHTAVRVLVSGLYDANSQKDYNPLYEMTGRPACGVNNVCLSSNATVAAVYRRSKRRLFYPATHGTDLHPLARV